MPLLPLKLRILNLLPGEQTKAVSDLQGAGDHLPNEDELLRRLRRRRMEEEVLILYGLGELSLSEANDLVAV